MQSCFHGNSQSPWLLTIYLAFPTVSFSINEKNSNSIENKISVSSKLRVKSAEWLKVVHSSAVYSKRVLSQFVLSFLAASRQFCCIHDYQSNDNKLSSNFLQFLMMTESFFYFFKVILKQIDDIEATSNHKDQWTYCTYCIQLKLVLKKS